MRHYDYLIGSIFHIFFFLSISLIAKNISAEPVFTDLNIKFEVIVEGLENRTGMAFVNNYILIIEKEGNLQLISNQSVEKQQIHQFSVDDKNERGLLGIETDGKNIFLFLTEIANDNFLRNRVYKFSLNGYELNNKHLLLDLPALPGPNHNGGKLVLEKIINSNASDNLFVVIGDLNHRGILQNIDSKDKPDDTVLYLG